MPGLKYPSLNGLRALSILFVILSHIQHQLAFVPGSVTFFKYVSFLVDGQLGVNVFFVISGFLITNLLLHEEAKTGEISLKNFYIRRILRIFPAYYFLLLVYFVFQLFHYIDIPHRAWVTAVTYTKYFNWKVDYFTAHAWSLSIEEHFYLLWPLFLSISHRSRKYFLYIIVILCPLIRIYYWVFNPDLSWINSLTIFQRFDSIAFGCLAALYQEKLTGFVLKNKKWLLLLTIPWFLIYPLVTIANLRYNMNIEWIIAPLAGSIGTVTNAAITIIMLISVYYTRGIWFKFLNIKIMDQIGVLSYSLYLWQQFFTSDVSVGKHIFPFNVILIFLAAIFSYNIIEKPFLKLKGKFAAK